jgi:diacylglycerol O-acyltransferase / wax synthase
VRSYLSPLDAVLLELEQEDEAAHLHIGWVAVFDPLPGGERPSLEKLRAQARERLEESSVLRRRLSSPRVSRRSLPVWLPDPDFDIGQLIRRASLPAPGGERELMDWLGEYFSRRLDRSRPLWETTLVENLEGGCWALATKVHLCLVDGFSAANLGAALLDAEPQPEEGVTTLADLLRILGEDADRNIFARLRGAVGEAVSGGIDTALHPQKVDSIVAGSQALAEMLVAGRLGPAPHTSLNGAIGATRRLVAVDVPLEEVERVKQDLGGSDHDVTLAVVAGGLRRLFEQREEDVDQIRAMVPVNLSRASEVLAGRDGASSLFADLAVAEPDPGVRYRRITAASARAKGAKFDGGSAMAASGLGAPMVQSVIARLAFTPRLFNVTVTDVPTFPITLYALGARMRRAIPLVPIFSGQALGIAVVSYDGKLTFGLHADRDALPDLEVIRDGIEQSLHALARVAA